MSYCSNSHHGIGTVTVEWGGDEDKILFTMSFSITHHRIHEALKDPGKQDKSGTLGYNTLANGNMLDIG